ncbi:MAG: hypothetical protein WD004_03125 [Actinomycetota bacterium]
MDPATDPPEAIFTPAELPHDIRLRIERGAGRRWETLEEAMRQLGVARLRLVGIYDDRQEAHFMLRTRIPGGMLTAAQAETIAAVADDFSVRPADETGPERFVELTTRQNIQLHWLRFENLPEVWARYDAVRLGSMQACGDSLRNVTSCPVAGVSNDEYFDVRHVVAAIQLLTETEPGTTARLPRKFKVAITACPTDCVLAGLHDLSFTPARNEERVFGFHVRAGGGLSDYPRLASPLPLFVLPDQVVDVVRATLELYRDEGDFEHKAVNRFRMLVHELGIEAITDGIHSRLPYALPGPGTGLSNGRAEDHLGVHAQPDGRSWVGLCVPVGRMTAHELSEVAMLSRLYGDGYLRVTQRQNLVLTGVRDVESLLAEPLIRDRFHADPDPFERGVIACTSAPFCKFALLDMKRTGRELIEDLRQHVPESKWPQLQGVRLHLSGCKASCAQVQAADIGFRATMGKDEDAYHPAVDISVGGGPDRLGQWDRLEVPLDEAFEGLGRALVAVATSWDEAGDGPGSDAGSLRWPGEEAGDAD